MKPTRIILNTPTIGGKIWLLDRKGMFVLEEGPGMMYTIACTHAGSGSITAYDGIPNEEGFFPDEEIADTDPDYATCNGRKIFNSNPAMMGSWMTNGGFMHGLTILAGGGMHESVALMASIVWMGAKKPKENANP